MAVRERLSEWFDRTLTSLRSLLESEEDEARASRTRATEAAVDRASRRLDELTEAQAKLDKRLSMTMGAVQAATTQLMALKEEVQLARNQAQQAMQRATSAHHTAESAADAATAAEARLSDRVADEE